MIEVDISTAFFVYLAFSLGGLLVSWIYFEYRRKAWHFNPLEKMIFRCKICAHSYMIEKSESISKCPQCGTLSDVASI
jgi:uncharacterized membrane protein YoaT (DUF817 family)